MNPKQLAFCSGRSCLSQLLEYHNKIIEELEKSNNVDVIYLDFVKGFDKVDHAILLNTFSIKQTTMCCHQWNNIKWSTSQKWHNPRVCVRTPPIPNTYIWYKIQNSTINSIILCWWYSDLLVIKDEEDTQMLQYYLPKLYKLADANSMKFNANKFELLPYWKEH